MLNTVETDIRERPATIPATWTCVSAIVADAGRFTALWGAYDRQADVLHVYAEYVATQTNLAVHAEAIRGRGERIPALFESTGRQRTRDEGLRIAQQLADLHINIFTVQLDQTARVECIAARLTAGRLRVFSTCPNWWAEYRRYGLGEIGEAGERDDHLMRATALLAMYGADVAVSENVHRLGAADSGLTTRAFYSRAEVLRMIPVSVTTLWRMTRDGQFPASVKLSPSRVGFPRASVDEWIKEKMESAEAT